LPSGPAATTRCDPIHIAKRANAQSQSIVMSKVRESSERMTRVI